MKNWEWKISVPMPDYKCPMPDSRSSSPTLPQRALAFLKMVFGLRTFPWCFMAIFWASTFLQIFSGTRSFWIYDRVALQGGEWWRLFTGHWVHFGWAHYVVDAGLFLLIGRCLEYQWPKTSRLALVLMPLAISGGLYFLDTEMLRYAGLSGLNVGFLVFLALDGWRKDKTDWFWPAVLALHVLEVWLEHTQGGVGGAMVPFDEPNVKVATSAHIFGVAYGVIWWLAAIALERKSPPTAPSPTPPPDQSTIKT